MNKGIINRDKDAKLHGEQIYYHPNGNISRIGNYHHGKRHGYVVWFYDDNTIRYKQYYNMGKLVYDETHYHKQIKIRI